MIFYIVPTSNNGFTIVWPEHLTSKQVAPESGADQMNYCTSSILTEYYMQSTLKQIILEDKCAGFTGAGPYFSCVFCLLWKFLGYFYHEFMWLSASPDTLRTTGSVMTVTNYWGFQLTSACLLLRHKANGSIGEKGQCVRLSTEFTSYLEFVKLWGYCSFTGPAFAVKLQCHSAVYIKLPVKIITVAVTLATDRWSSVT